MSTFKAGGLTLRREGEDLVVSIGSKHRLETVTLDDRAAEELQRWLSGNADKPVSLVGTRIRCNDPRSEGRTGTVHSEDGDRCVIQWDQVTWRRRQVTRVAKDRVGTSARSGYTVLS